jgi:hypothetical protein
LRSPPLRTVRAVRLAQIRLAQIRLAQIRLGAAGSAYRPA